MASEYSIQNEKSQANGSSNGKNTQNVHASKSSIIIGGQVSSEEDPRRLIPELCKHFYHLGWASGTGGGLSIRQGGIIFCAPSGVQKERIAAQDMFVLDERTLSCLERPQNENLKVSECLSLFKVAFDLRDAGCCIHSHSIYANLITALCNDNQINSNENKYDEFRISHQEMIKGIKIGSTGRNLNYNDTLVVPIINNVLFERDLAGAMRGALLAYPDTNAVLVRNHGVYVWGRTWQQAKSMAECYDYLFKLKLEAHRLCLDWMKSA